MKKQIVGYIGIIGAAILLGIGIYTKIPPKEISMFSFEENGYEEYVGGDAYNIQIEAALRGGEIAGAKTAKAVYFSSSMVVFIFSLFLFSDFGSERDLTTEPVRKNNQTI